LACPPVPPRRPSDLSSIDEPVPVDAFAGQGQEQSARAEAARVELDRAGDGGVGIAPDEASADDRGDLAEREVDHRVLSSVPPGEAVYSRRLTNSSAARALSSNGWTTPATSCPV